MQVCENTTRLAKCGPRTSSEVCSTPAKGTFMAPCVGASSHTAEVLLLRRRITSRPDFCARFSAGRSNTVPRAWVNCVLSVSALTPGLANARRHCKERMRKLMGGFRSCFMPCPCYAVTWTSAAATSWPAVVVASTV